VLPLIRSQARRVFRWLRPELKQELVQDVVENAYVAFARLVRRGREGLAFATSLANFAIRQVIAGSRVGAKLNIRDVTSVVAQRQWGFYLQSLLPDCSTNAWSGITGRRHAHASARPSGVSIGLPGLAENQTCVLMGSNGLMIFAASFG
jgi:hypothetical protein